MDKTFFWILVLLLVLSQVGGNFLGFYKSIWEYDSLVHFVGGIWAGIIGLFFCANVFQQNATKNRRIFYAIFASFVIGVLWENYQFYIQGGVYGSYDTTLDIICDVLGGIVAAIKYHKYFE